MPASVSHRVLRFEYWKSAIDHQWYWHLKTAEGQKIAQGEAYATKSSCLAAIALVKAASGAEIEDLSPGEK